MNDQYTYEWTIWNAAGNYPLISVGDREANEERLRELERHMPGQYYLVARQISPWQKVEVLNG